MITAGRLLAAAALSVVEVVDTATEDVRCIECGDELPVERAELGYRYCTKDACQARHHRGLLVTTVGMNKSGDTVIVADPAEVRRRGESGEFGKKDTGLALDYRPVRAGSGAAAPRSTPRTPARAAQVGRAARPWTAEQEKLVRVYHEMGLNPRQIAERARTNAPGLGISESLAVRILSAPPSRR